MTLYVIPGQEVVYLSSDRICKDESTHEDNSKIHSIEFLNNILCYDLLFHKLTFKVRVLVMLIRNIDQSR